MKHPEAGGAEVIMYEVFRRLRSRGHRILFITGGFRGGAAREDVGGLETHRVGNTYTFNIAGPRHLRRLAAAESFDVVVEDINKIPFFTPRWVPSLPTVGVVPHLFGTTVYEQASWPIATYVYLHEKLIPSVYRECRFSVLSGTTRDDLIARGIPPERIHVIHAGIDLDAYPLRSATFEPPGPVITYLGRVKRYKGIDLPMRALPALRRRIADVRYRIVGEGDHLSELERLAGELGVRDAVDLVGFKEGADKIDELARTRVLTYTSPKEGWGLSVIEAGAVGVPSIASDSPGLRESVRHRETGLLVPHGDVAALTEALEHLLTDDDTWRRMARAARGWAETFSWDRMADQTLELIDRVVDERRVAAR